MYGRPSKLLCVGALTQDTIFRLDALPSGGGKFLPIDAVQIAAGMASSAATAARLQGVSVSLWASVGDDVTGRSLIEEISAEDIDCSLVRRVENGRSAIATILLDAVGERMIVPFYDPITHADPNDTSIDFRLFDAVLVDTRWPGAAIQALTKARELGILGILDADIAPAWILRQLAPLASHIIASQPACRLLLDGDPGLDESARSLNARYGCFVAVTAGADGTSFCRAPDLVAHIPAYRIDAVDTLAAGDVFHGAFAARLLQTGSEAQALQHASAAAALKCLRFGGRLGAPTFKETVAFMETLES